MNDVITLPIGWILGIIGTLGGVIATLAGVLWSTMKSRLEAQDTIIAGLRADIERMAKGCGAEGCLWRHR
jgi:hypothetical protein